MATGNPWFWGEHVSRWTFERELERTAVHLRDKNARVVVKKVDIKEVAARKNKLAAQGILVMSTNVKNSNIATMSVPRKIK